MTGKLQLLHGDLFDGPTDLIVLPCSTVGTVTDTVRRRLRAFKIPRPKWMKIGEIDFQQSPIALQQLAKFLAFAASVGGFASNLQAIEYIGRRLGSFAANNSSILQISVPLLGTGAGLLEPYDAVKSLTNGFLQTAPKQALMKIYILDEAIYEQLRIAFGDQIDEVLIQDQDKLKDTFNPIRVFISYTKTNEEHSSWVKDLAGFLRENGIDARLDQWHLTPGQDVAQWMCNEIELAERVLMICNEEYAMRADGHHGGVGWEIRLIEGYLLQDGASNSSKFIPLVRTTEYKSGLPSFLLATYYLHWPPENRNESELKRFNQNALSNSGRSSANWGTAKLYHWELQKRMIQQAK